jgi:hypothetical protein
MFLAEGLCDDRPMRRLINAPHGLHSCDICVWRCVELIGEQVEMERMVFPRARPVRSPRWWASGYRWRAVRAPVV